MKYKNLTSDNISNKCKRFGISSQHYSLIFNQLNNIGFNADQAHLIIFKPFSLIAIQSIANNYQLLLNIWKFQFEHIAKIAGFAGHAILNQVILYGYSLLSFGYTHEMIVRLATSHHSLTKISFLANYHGRIHEKGLSNRQILDEIIRTHNNDLFNKFAPMIGIPVFLESIQKCDNYPNP